MLFVNLPVCALILLGAYRLVPGGRAGGFDVPGAVVVGAGLLNASQQLGTALGLAIFSAIATARTSTLLAARAPRDAALTAGFHRALLAP